METNDLYTMTEARKLLRIGKNKMWRLVNEGTLEVIPNPLDKRHKLVRCADIDKLLQYRKKAP